MSSIILWYLESPLKAHPFIGYSVLRWTIRLRGFEVLEASKQGEERWLASSSGHWWSILFEDWAISVAMATIACGLITLIFYVFV